MKINIVRCALFALVLLTMTGCSSVWIPAQALHRPPEVGTYELASTFAPQLSENLVLFPGTYTAVGEVNGGVLYKGSSDCQFYSQKGRFDYYDTWDGGFWLPNDPSKKAMFFRYHGSLKTYRVKENKNASDAYILDIAYQNRQSSAAEIAVAANSIVSAAPFAQNGSVLSQGVGVGIASGVVAMMIQSDNEEHQGHIWLGGSFDRTELMRVAKPLVSQTYKTP